MDKEQKLQLKKIVKNPAMSWIFGVSGKLKLGVLLLVLLNSAISISAVAFALVLREDSRLVLCHMVQYQERHMKLWLLP